MGRKVVLGSKELDQLFEPLPLEKSEVIHRDQLLSLLEVQRQANEALRKELKRVKKLNKELEERELLLDEQLVLMQGKLYGRSSEKSSGSTSEAGEKKQKESKRSGRKQRPSERYSGAEVIEQEFELKELPSCDRCQSQMKKSGLFEESEYLTVIPARYYMVRQKRHKYSCGKCYGCIKTTPGPKRINTGSSYSDDIIIDASVSKYCDLIPMERYSAMARRGGLDGNIPANSLIDQTHVLADFLKGVYQGIKEEVQSSEVVLADETPHRMLEGSKKSGWYLWGFSNARSSYFDCRDTRSGSVASDFLKESQAKYLMSDVFSGYGKAVIETNKIREGPPLLNTYCNAHARRKFKESVVRYPGVSDYVGKLYGQIYRLERIAKGRRERQVMRLRGYMKPLFKKLKVFVEQKKFEVSNKSKASKAIDYFLKNYEGLTRFIDQPQVPIDNNAQERLLRNPVIGRKTWYGTHSPKGARTMAVMFSIMQSCRLNKVNPREYLKTLVSDIHHGKAAYTPLQFAQNQKIAC